MTRLLFTAAFFAASAIVPQMSLADTTAVDRSQDGTAVSAAQLEYDVRLAEFQAGRSPASISISANKRLLRVALMTTTPNAVSDYDLRAMKIESIAETNLKLRTSTERDVRHAKAARLDSWLLDVLAPNAG